MDPAQGEDVEPDEHSLATGETVWSSDSDESTSTSDIPNTRERRAEQDDLRRLPSDESTASSDSLSGSDSDESTSASKISITRERQDNLDDLKELPFYESTDSSDCLSGSDTDETTSASDFPHTGNNCGEQDGLRAPSSDSTGSSDCLSEMSDEMSEMGHEDLYGSQLLLGGRQTAILRTNRQIYIEASSLMYSQLRMVLRARDLVEFGSKTDILMPSKGVWRYQPWEDSYATTSSGKTIYDGPERSGPMEPHVFARFQKISFDAYFDLGRHGLIEHVPDLRAGFDMASGSDVDLLLVSYLKKTRIIKNLARLLARSHLVSELALNLNVKVYPYWEDERMFIPGGGWRTCQRTNKRATALFLDCGRMLDPLLELCSVRSFNWKISVRSDGETSPTINMVDTPYEPEPMHAQILPELKMTIEQNYVAKQQASSKTA